MHLTIKNRVIVTGGGGLIAPVWDPASIATATRDWFAYLGKA